MQQQCRRTAPRTIYISDNQPTAPVQYPSTYQRPQYQPSYQQPQFQPRYQLPQPPPQFSYQRPVYYQPRFTYQSTLPAQLTYRQSPPQTYPYGLSYPQQGLYQQHNRRFSSQPEIDRYAPTTYAPTPQPNKRVDQRYASNMSYAPSSGYQHSQRVQPRSLYTFPQVWNPPVRTRYAPSRGVPKTPTARPTPMRGWHQSPTRRVPDSSVGGAQYNSWNSPPRSPQLRAPSQMFNRQQQLYEREPIRQRRPDSGIPAHLLTIPPMHQPPVEPEVYGGEPVNIDVPLTGMVPNKYGLKKQYKSVWAYRTDAGHRDNPMQREQDLHYYMYDNPNQGRFNRMPWDKALDFNSHPMKRANNVKSNLSGGNNVKSDFKPEDNAQYPMQRPKGSAGEVFPDFRLEVAAVNSRNLGVRNKSMRLNPSLDTINLRWV